MSWPPNHQTNPYWITEWIWWCIPLGLFLNEAHSSWVHNKMKKNKTNNNQKDLACEPESQSCRSKEQWLQYITFSQYNAVQVIMVSQRRVTSVRATHSKVDSALWCHRPVLQMVRCGVLAPQSGDSLRHHLPMSGQRTALKFYALIEFSLLRRGN